MRYTKTAVIALALATSSAACGDDPTGPSPVVCADACDRPPAALCLDDAITLRSFASPGSCGADAQCSYGHVDLACEHACADGACVAAIDPCAHIVCNAPPPARCAADALETFASLGTCSAGVCAYGSIAVACSHGCVDDAGAGACAGDPCAAVSCTTPPSPCHAALGTCSSGVCSYAVLGGAGCDDGVACTEDDACSAAGACAGRAIACQSPPAPVCDGATLRVAAATGTCSTGICDYPVTEVACADGCADGACLGDPCADVVCATPPSPCHSATGTCENGVCAYAFDNGAACDDGVACSDDDRCTNGVCAGVARACTTPEAASCKDDATLVARAASGTCSAGACSYLTIEVPCAFGCVTVEGIGQCEGDPCGGVTCATPAPAACANSTSSSSRRRAASASAAAATTTTSCSAARMAARTAATARPPSARHRSGS